MQNIAELLFIVLKDWIDSGTQVLVFFIGIRSYPAENIIADTIYDGKLTIVSSWYSMFMHMIKIGELNSMYDHDSIHCTQ